MRQPRCASLLLIAFLGSIPHALTAAAQPPPGHPLPKPPPSQNSRLHDAVESQYSEGVHGYLLYGNTYTLEAGNATHATITLEALTVGRRVFQGSLDGESVPAADLAELATLEVNGVRQMSGEFVHVNEHGDMTATTGNISAITLLRSSLRVELAGFVNYSAVLEPQLAFVRVADVEDHTNRTWLFITPSGWPFDQVPILLDTARPSKSTSTRRLASCKGDKKKCRVFLPEASPHK